MSRLSSNYAVDNLEIRLHDTSQHSSPLLSRSTDENKRTQIMSFCWAPLFLGTHMHLENPNHCKILNYNLWPRLQNSRFRTFLEGAKRHKHDPRVWSVNFLASFAILPRRFYTRSRPFIPIWSVARIRKKYDCFAVYLILTFTSQA